MDGLHVSSNYHVSELTSGDGRGSSGAVGPLFVVLAIIMVLGVVAGFIGRVCSGRHWGGDTQYDFEGWVEKRCASCIDGDIEAPPPPPPPVDKPPQPEAPPPEVPPPAADAPPPPVAEAAPPPADTPAPASDPAPAADAPASTPAAEAPAAAPAAEAPAAPPAEATPPPPSDPLPPPPPPPPPLEDHHGGAPAAYVWAPTEPATFRQLYPYSCNCHVCAREGIFE